MLGGMYMFLSRRNFPEPISLWGDADAVVGSGGWCLDRAVLGRRCIDPGNSGKSHPAGFCDCDLLVWLGVKSEPGISGCGISLAEVPYRRAEEEKLPVHKSNRGIFHILTVLVTMLDLVSCAVMSEAMLAGTR